MTHERPLPTVIGPTENVLRALLAQTLAATKIGSYSAWVVLNAAAASTQEAGDAWRQTVSDALKVTPDAVDEVLSQLTADGLTNADGSVTHQGATELTRARSAVSETTARLIQGLSQDEQATTRRVLDQIRQKAEDLLVG